MKVFGRCTHAEINIAAVVDNFKQISALAPNSQTLAVIKADAYGHGAVPIAQALSKNAEAFAVAFIDEAVHLREHAIVQPILLLEGVMSEPEMLLAYELDLWVMLHTKEHFEWLRNLTPTQRPKVWIKVDTGMHRLGIELTEVESILAEFNELLTPSTVLCSHLACADEKYNQANVLQTNQLEKLALAHGLPFSLANSAGILEWPNTYGAWNRLGIALYGSSLINTKELMLQPVMKVTAPIIALRTLEKGECVGYGQSWTAQRKTIIATVAIGYADGYPRHARVGTPAWLHDKKVPLVGRVSMDMITFDVTDIGQVKVADNIELWGEHVSVEEVAECASTISYELLSRLSPRVKRSYINN
jgi:alanine racemase